MTQIPPDRSREPGIELPDLEDSHDRNIVAENVRSMGPMIVAALFEELKVAQVVDRIVERFRQGMLPIGGGAGRMRSRRWRQAPSRIGERDRRRLEAIVRDAMTEAAMEAVGRLADRASACASPQDYTSTHPDKGTGGDETGYHRRRRET